MGHVDTLEPLRSASVRESGRRKSAGDVSGHDESMAALTFGDILHTLQISQQMWSRRAERKADEVKRYPLRKRDIHVSVCHSEGFRETRMRANEAKLNVENGAQESSTMAQRRWELQARGGCWKRKRCTLVRRPIRSPGGDQSDFEGSPSEERSSRARSGGAAEEMCRASLKFRSSDVWNAGFSLIYLKRVLRSSCSLKR